MLETNSAGKDIHAYCSKCELDLDHTIMAMDGEKISKVRCKSCGNSHKFSAPGAARTIRKPRAKQEAGEAATAELVWEAVIVEAKGKERDYSMASKYRIGDIVNHHTFGKGIVKKLYVNKCDILFKDRERLMVSTNE